MGRFRYVFTLLLCVLLWYADDVLLFARIFHFRFDSLFLCLRYTSAAKHTPASTMTPLHGHACQRLFGDDSDESASHPYEADWMPLDLYLNHC